jgi:hypothetical protein
MGDCGTEKCILGWEIVGMKSAYLDRSLRRWRECELEWEDVGREIRYLGGRL